VIRRSRDGGETWTAPVDATTGLLRNDGQYHCAPTPVIEHAGRLWRGMERRMPPTGWGSNYCAGVMSAPLAADLLNTQNWTFSNFLPSARQWNGGDMFGVAPKDQLFLYDVTSSYAKSGLYWTLANVVTPKGEAAGRPANIRNTLALTSSSALTNWTQRAVLLSHTDTAKHGFQYPDWQFDGDDIIAVCRTAFDDGLGGARSYHDANLLTFHRWRSFRELKMDASIPPPVKHP
jgi:hypothetical protein